MASMLWGAKSSVKSSALSQQQRDRRQQLQEELRRLTGAKAEAPTAPERAAIFKDIQAVLLEIDTLDRLDRKPQRRAVAAAAGQAVDGVSVVELSQLRARLQAAQRELQDQAANAVKEKDRLLARIRDLESKLDAANRQVAEALGANAGEASEQLQAELREAQKEVTSLRADLNASQEALINADADRGILEKRLKESKDRITQLNAEARQLEEDKNARIADLEASVRRIEGQNSRSVRSGVELEERIRDLESQLNDAQNALKNQQRGDTTAVVGLSEALNREKRVSTLAVEAIRFLAGTFALGVPTSEFANTILKGYSSTDQSPTVKFVKKSINIPNPDLTSTGDPRPLQQIGLTELINSQKAQQKVASDLANLREAATRREANAAKERLNQANKNFAQASTSSTFSPDDVDDARRARDLAGKQAALAEQQANSAEAIGDSLDLKEVEIKFSKPLSNGTPGGKKLPEKLIVSGNPDRNQLIKFYSDYIAPSLNAARADTTKAAEIAALDQTNLPVWAAVQKIAEEGSELDGEGRQNVLYFINRVKLNAENTTLSGDDTRTLSGLLLAAVDEAGGAVGGGVTRDVVLFNSAYNALLEQGDPGKFSKNSDSLTTRSRPLARFKRNQGAGLFKHPAGKPTLQRDQFNAYPSVRGGSVALGKDYFEKIGNKFTDIRNKSSLFPPFVSTDLARADTTGLLDDKEWSKLLRITWNSSANPGLITIVNGSFSGKSKSSAPFPTTISSALPAFATTLSAALSTPGLTHDEALSAIETAHEQYDPTKHDSANNWDEFGVDIRCRLEEAGIADDQEAHIRFSELENRLHG